MPLSLACYFVNDAITLHSSNGSRYSILLFIIAITNTNFSSLLSSLTSAARRFHLAHFQPRNTRLLIAAIFDIIFYFRRCCRRRFLIFAAFSFLARRSFALSRRLLSSPHSIFRPPSGLAFRRRPRPKLRQS